MNVHRWRKLEGSDPATYEMIQKIQTLQKRLIMKTEEVVEKDLLIQEKEKLYVELKNILARQPGPEVAEQLSVYQHNLKEKTRQMKAMASELNMHQAQVNEHRFEIERLTRELQVSVFIYRLLPSYDYYSFLTVSYFFFFLLGRQA
jgi:preprotein translocase subunit Sec63